MGGSTDGADDNKSIMSAIEKDILYRQRLIMRAQQGDKVALEEFRELNKGLFEQTISRYKKWVSVDQLKDLRQEGFIGLMVGIQRYNPQKATAKKPEGYVFQWVRAYVSQYARDNGKGEAKKLVSENYTVAEEGDDTISLFDCIKDENEDVSKSALDSEVHDMMIAAIRQLLPKEKIIARRRLFADIPDTLEDIGDDLGVSRERIRQIETEVREKLRKRMARKLHEMFEERNLAGDQAA